jgi:hypothetical protein
MARFTRNRTPDEREPQRRLSLTACVLDCNHSPSAEFFEQSTRSTAVKTESAASIYWEALILN